MDTYTIPPDYDAFRIDKTLTLLMGKSREHIKALIQAQRVQCNQQVITKATIKVRAGDVLHVEDILPPPPSHIQPEFQKLDIVYEDKDVLVMNKPAGMVVHPAPGHRAHTLTHFLLGHCQSIVDVGDVLRPGIVHRLDKDTSGLIIVAKTQEAHAILSEDFRPRIDEDHPDACEKTIVRTYYAVVWGKPAIRSTIRTKIARHAVHRQKMCVLPCESAAKRGKLAITQYERVQTWRSSKGGELSLVQFRLHTGRTHQIRVHCQYIQHPIVGDPVYGKRHFLATDRSWPERVLHFPRQALHAKSIQFPHPITREPLSFSVPFPEDMEELIASIQAHSVS